VYKGIYEMMPTDRPEDSVVQNDDAFDAWYEKFQRDTAMQAAKLKAQRDGKTVSNPHAQSRVAHLTPEAIKRQTTD
jgi:hypothetical protein